MDALASFITRKLNVEEKRKNWPERDKEYIEYPGCMVRLRTRLYMIWDARPRHVGCVSLMSPGPPQHATKQLSGYLLVNRVPGNFHIEARSKAHNLNAVRLLLHSVAALGRWPQDSAPFGSVPTDEPTNLTSHPRPTGHDEPVARDQPPLLRHAA